MPPDLSQIRPVLLCGGSGSRLAPLSTPEKPKAFLPLLSDYSMLQETALRFRECKQPVILCNRRHDLLVKQDLEGLGIKADIIIKEPVKKNTGPALSLAARYYEQINPEELLFISACDLSIKDLEVLKFAITQSKPFAEQGYFILFGEKPSKPETSYGYIQPQKSEEEEQVTDISMFCEKPELNQAVEYLQKGCLWNTGMFLTTAETLAQAYRNHAPEIWNITRKMDFHAPSLNDFEEYPDISIDYALIEKMPNIKVCPVSMAWNDIGTPERLKALA